MFDDQINALLRRNADVIEIQSELLTHAAQGILDALQARNKFRILNNILTIKKALRKINEEFDDIVFLVD